MRINMIKYFFCWISEHILKMETLKLKIHNKKSRILKHLVSNDNILINLNNLILILYESTDLNLLEKFKNLNYLEICTEFKSKSKIIIPELKKYRIFKN